MQAISLYEPISRRLARVEDRLKSLAKFKFPFLAQLLDHVFDTEGKRVRPAITLISSNFNPHDEATTGTMAAAVEMLHIATLIHDDTVDNSDIRRGKATVSNLWGKDTAVLLGDYMFAKSATFVCDTGNIRVIKRFAETIMELSSGQLHETVVAYQNDQDMTQYFIYRLRANLCLN